MNRIHALCLILMFLSMTAFDALAQPDTKSNGMTKEQYYNNVLAPRDGLQPLVPELKKKNAFEDRKRSVLNVGNVFARIRNSAVLGYDRDGLCYEFPKNSGITYRWVLGPLIGGIKNGRKFTATGVRGATRTSEDEFQPLPGYDAGIEDKITNIGIAFSDKPESWPKKWPDLNDLPTHARKVNYTQPKIGRTGFPGALNGEVVATREAYFVVTDNDPVNGNQPAPLDVRIDVWGMQWDDFINQDFIIYRFVVTNIGTTNIDSMYIGIHDDPDCPEQGAAEWTDDYAAFIRQGDDVEGYTASEDSLLWNFTYLWDGDDKAQGFIASGVGWLGLKFLETPINPKTGKPFGVTTFQVFPYPNAPKTDETAYDQLAAGIMPPDHKTPDSKDWTQTPNSYGPDITYAVAAGPLTLKPGESVPFTFASVHGRNKKELLNHAMLCQILFNNNYEAAESPPEPVVTAVPGNKKVTLYWDDRAEKGVYYRADGTVDHVNDRLTKTNSFEGYKIYRSTDRGQSWGPPIFDVNGSLQGYVPLATYDLKNGINGESTSRRFFYLGDDTGLRHTFMDNNVKNGYEYWYAVVAYDHDDGPIPPLANSIKTNPYIPGSNTVAITPQRLPSGASVGSAQDSAKHIAGSADMPGFVIRVVDPSKTTGKTYKVANFGDLTPYVGKFSVVDAATNAPIRDLVGREVKDRTFYNEELDNAPTFDGVQILVTDPPEPGVKSTDLGSTTLRLRDVFSLYQTGNADFVTDIKREAWGSDYEIRFTGVTQTYTDWSNGTPVTAGFEVWNLTTNKKITCEIGDARASLGGNNNGRWDPAERIYIVNSAYIGNGQWTGDYPADYPFRVRFQGTSTATIGDKFTIRTFKLLAANDVYTFKTERQTTATMTQNDLAEITTVPNPYIVSSPYEILKFGTQKQLQFHRLPPQCTIRIYNTAGEVVQTLQHTDGTAIERWNLQTYNGQEIAFGVYIYHVDAPGIGEHFGKFAVIK